MTLWLEENDFGIFRSTDLLKWEQTDRLTFKEAWECPDLVCLKDEKGNETWMFWSADGFTSGESLMDINFRPTVCVMRHTSTR